MKPIPLTETRLAELSGLLDENAMLKADNWLLRSLSFRDERDALKEQVARLEDLNRKLCDKTNTLTIQSARLEETITTMQSKSAALVDALEAFPTGFHAKVYGAECKCSMCEAVHKKVAALAAFKE